MTPPVRFSSEVVSSEDPVHIALELEEIWNAHENGYVAGDHHFHLNYGGPFDLAPSDLMLPIEAERLDIATPLLANLHARLMDLEWAGWKATDALPYVVFGQEIRADAHGHVGIVGAKEQFRPWYWGPDPTQPQSSPPSNADALALAQANGGLAFYVHPVIGREPFAEDYLARLPMELVSDAILGNVDALEIVCLWSDEIGTSKLWYELLNIGVPIAPSAGTDAFPNMYRSMALGTTRVLVRADREKVTFHEYLHSLRSGNSIVTNGPVPIFSIGNARPGELVSSTEAASWALTVHSVSPLERVEIIVNGEIVWRGAPKRGRYSQDFSGVLSLPEGGWVAARAIGTETEWPSMDSYPFGHTAPIWIGEVGSTDKVSEDRARRRLLDALSQAEVKLEQVYSGIDSRSIRDRFAKARLHLEVVDLDPVNK